ncbi:hypothetical protein D9M71_801610 [compost metagenome]
MQLVIEVAPVVQAGEAVLQRQYLQLRFQLQALAVVARHGDQVFVPALADQLRIDFRRLRTAVAAQHLMLENHRQVQLVRLADLFQPGEIARD